MCGRFVQTLTAVEIQRLFRLASRPPESERHFNVAPGTEILVIRAPEGVREGALALWGLEVPDVRARNARGTGARLAPINARSESIFDRPLWRSVIERRRCLVPATGFYEWRRRGKNRDPFLIQRQDAVPFAMAAVWAEGPVSPLRQGESTLTCAVLTTEARGVVASIHDRMPVILGPDRYDRWLDAAPMKESELGAVLEGQSFADLVMRRVSKRVGSVANEDSALLAEIADAGAADADADADAADADAHGEAGHAPSETGAQLGFRFD
ncbi:MAG: SOS response-associated peptidase [Deltaproteobacteria bacterium]|nr:SOS response-associated peptidase [Deltaproteobacteria bacterium]